MDFIKITSVLFLLITTACVPSAHTRQHTLANVPTFDKLDGNVALNGCESTHQFGCSNAMALQSMIADENDLIEGRDPGHADGNTAAASIHRYWNSETYELSDSVSITEISQ